MDACALLGGPKENWPADLKERLAAAKATGQLLIGVDRGALFMLEMGLAPDLAVGDFDSLKPRELSWVEGVVPDLRYSVPKKDWTDSELMLGIAFEDYQLDQLRIYGATGGRMDHALINLFGILNPDLRPYANQVSLEDKQNLIVYRNAGSYAIPQEGDYAYFGVTCLTPVRQLTIRDALYELAPYDGDYLRSFTSNEFLPGRADFKLSLASGSVAVVYSKDLIRFDQV